MDPLRAFHEHAASVAAAVSARPRGTRWFLHCDTDADGLSSAAVVATALLRIGHNFQVRASRDKTQAGYERMFTEDAGGHFVLDKGTSHSPLLAQEAARKGIPVVLLDHHNTPDEAFGAGDSPHAALAALADQGLHVLNPRVFGLDGSRDASSSTTCVAFAVALGGDAGWTGAPAGLVGAVGDWQHMDGWHGWNQVVMEEGLERGHLQQRLQPGYIGHDLAEAIARRPEPDLPGLTGDPKAAAALLDELDIPDVGDASALERGARSRLVSGLVLHGLAHGVSATDLERVVRPGLYHARLKMEIRHAFRTVDACAREGAYATGIAFLMGDTAARQEAEALYTRYRDTLGAALERLRTDGTEPRTATQHFHIDRPAYTGMVGGLGMTLVVEDRARPMVVTAPRPDGDVQVSTRGTDEQVAAGMDLGEACRRAGEKVGREGGGHPVAAGIVVAPDDLDRFLDALDEALIAQGFMEAP